MENQLATWPHISVILLTVVITYYGLEKLKTDRPYWIGVVVLAPVPFLFLMNSLPPLVFGKEGVIEAITEGLLLWIVVKAIAIRQPWMILGALFILLEEIDYGQLFFSMPTPDWLLEIPENRSQTINFHNISNFYLLWTLVPIAAIVALSFDRVHQKFSGFNLPRFQHATWQGLLFTAIFHEVFTKLTSVSADSYLSVATNELYEWTLIAIVSLGWLAQKNASSSTE